MSDNSSIEARLSVLERTLSEFQAKLQKCESTPPLKIEAGKVFIEEAPIKNAAISAASDECIAANREAIIENAVRIDNTLGMNTDAYKAKDDDAVSHAEKYDELHSWKMRADAYIAANRDAAFESAMRTAGRTNKRRGSMEFKDLPISIQNIAIQVFADKYSQSITLFSKQEEEPAKTLARDIRDAFTEFYSLA